MRLQLALNVHDLVEAVSYYSKLFGVGPHKRYSGYANFAIDDPPLKLVLFENPGSEKRLHHLGVEVLEANQLEKAFQRLTEAELVAEVERDETCCYATQDKVWSRELDGLSWEWYRITDDSSERARASVAKTCCPSEGGLERSRIT